MFIRFILLFKNKFIKIILALKSVPHWGRVWSVNFYPRARFGGGSAIRRRVRVWLNPPLSRPIVMPMCFIEKSLLIQHHMTIINYIVCLGPFNNLSNQLPSFERPTTNYLNRKPQPYIYYNLV